LIKSDNSLILEQYLKIRFLKYLQIKSPSAKAKGLGISKLPRQNDFRTFCMSDETEKVYHKLEEAIGIC